MAASAEMHGPDIGKLLREEVPLTAAKLAKLLAACEDADDRTLLIHAAMRDFIGEEEYQARFCTYKPAQESFLQESTLSGPSFHAQFPIDPVAEQTLHYLVDNAQHSRDVIDALRLLHRILDLPAPSTATPKSGDDLNVLLRHLAAPPSSSSGPQKAAG